MKKSLPSLNSIRFFESAARHLSFTRAGEELFVTQGAVSKQIKLLEQQLGLQLFARKGPYLTLTKHGEKLFNTVTTALKTIEHGINSLQHQSESTLTITVLPSFASNWLLPRMRQFDIDHPELSIRLASSYANIDFAVETDIDLGIRLGKGNWPGLYSAQITTDRMFPACSPATAKTIKTISDLRKHTVLVDFQLHDEWERWFLAAGYPYQVKNRRHYDDSGTQIRSAVEGQGVSLVREELVQEYVDSGVLVRLFDIEFYSDLHYHFVCLENRKDEHYIAVFRKWLIEQGSYFESARNNTDE